MLREALPLHARRRGVVVLVHGRGPTSPWCPAAATLDAVVRGCLDAGVAARWDALGRPPAVPGALAQLAAPSTDRRSLALGLAASACVIPRAWVGRHVVLVLPLVVGPAEGGAPERGPWHAALAALAAAACARGDQDPVAVGAAALCEVFAGFTCVIDARSALLRPRRVDARPRRIALDRVFVHGATGLSPAELVARAGIVDQWLQRRDGQAGVVLHGGQAGDPWPARPAEPMGVDGPVWSARPRARDREARRS